jgi:triphosphoribosyl-dephospho-CoA synthetase
MATWVTRVLQFSFSGTNGAAGLCGLCARAVLRSIQQQAASETKGIVLMLIGLGVRGGTEKDQILREDPARAIPSWGDIAKAIIPCHQGAFAKRTRNCAREESARIPILQQITLCEMEFLRVCDVAEFASEQIADSLGAPPLSGQFRDRPVREVRDQ